MVHGLQRVVVCPADGEISPPIPARRIL